MTKEIQESISHSKMLWNALKNASLDDYLDVALGWVLLCMPTIIDQIASGPHGKFYDDHSISVNGLGLVLVFFSPIVGAIMLQLALLKIVREYKSEHSIDYEGIAVTFTYFIVIFVATGCFLPTGFVFLIYRFVFASFVAVAYAWYRFKSLERES